MVPGVLGPADLAVHAQGDPRGCCGTRVARGDGLLASLGPRAANAPASSSIEADLELDQSDPSHIRTRLTRSNLALRGVRARVSGDVSVLRGATSGGLPTGSLQHRVRRPRRDHRRPLLAPRRDTPSKPRSRVAATADPERARGRRHRRWLGERRPPRPADRAHLAPARARARRADRRGARQRRYRPRRRDAARARRGRGRAARLRARPHPRLDATLQIEAPRPRGAPTPGWRACARGTSRSTTSTSRSGSTCCLPAWACRAARARHDRPRARDPHRAALDGVSPRGSQRHGRAEGRGAARSRGRSVDPPGRGVQRDSRRHARRRELAAPRRDRAVALGRPRARGAALRRQRQPLAPLAPRDRLGAAGPVVHLRSATRSASFNAPADSSSPRRSDGSRTPP